MTDFHKTGAGQIFYGKHVPELVKELRRIADNLEKGNKLYEREMKLDKKKKNSLEEKLDDVKETEKIDKTNLAVNDNVHTKKDPDLEGLDD